MTNRMSLRHRAFSAGRAGVGLYSRSNIIIAAIGFAQRMAIAGQPAVNWEDGGTWQNNGESHPILLSF